MKRGLFMTHTEIIDKMSSAMQDKVTLDESTLEYLEEVLISADLGVETSLDLVERVRKNALAEQVSSPSRLRKILSDEIAELLRDAPVPRRFGRGPLLTLGGGVGGAGETTSPHHRAPRPRRAVAGRAGAPPVRARPPADPGRRGQRRGQDHLDRQARPARPAGP